MKKILQLLAIVAMMAGIGSAVAQAPQKMNYQAVIRNGNGELVATSDIGARVAIVNAANAEVYSETHQATTNENGLLVLSLGAGSPESGSFEAIDWSNGTYSVRVQIDITGGSNYTVASEQALMSVPYALLASKAQSVKYSDVTDKPTIPSSVSELTNDAGYITSDQVFMNGDQLHVGNTVVTISGNGFDGDYNSLTNKPTIPTAVSELTNDANYITIDDVEVTLEGTTLTVGN